MPVEVNPFDRQIVYLRNPRGGVEDIAAMYAAGYRTFLLTMQDVGYSYEPWKTVIDRITPYPDAVWLPWAFLWEDREAWKLRDCVMTAYQAQLSKLRRPAGCWNAEKPLDPTPGPGHPGASVTLENLIAAADGCDVLLSTTPWPFPINYAMIPHHWILDLQLFPAENDTSRRGRDCRSKFFSTGVQCRVHFQHGIHDVSPGDLPWPYPGRFSIYAADDANQDFARWTSRPLTPVSAEEFPFLGPFYGPSNKYGYPVSMNKQIRQIKLALHNAGYADFTNPDGMWNRKVETAWRHFQKDHGLPRTGQYGRAGWTLLRQLASANLGEGLALR